MEKEFKVKGLKGVSDFPKEEKFDLSEEMIEQYELGKFKYNFCKEEAIKEFIKRERGLLNELFKKINKQDIGRGIIYKKDWDEFIIKRDKLAGEKFA